MFSRNLSDVFLHLRPVESLWLSQLDTALENLKYWSQVRYVLIVKSVSDLTDYYRNNVRYYINYFQVDYTLKHQ